MATDEEQVGSVRFLRECSCLLRLLHQSNMSNLFCRFYGYRRRQNASIMTLDQEEEPENRQ